MSIWATPKLPMWSKIVSNLIMLPSGVQKSMLLKRECTAARLIFLFFYHLTRVFVCFVTIELAQAVNLYCWDVLATFQAFLKDNIIELVSFLASLVHEWKLLSPTCTYFFAVFLYPIKLQFRLWVPPGKLKCWSW